MSTTASSLHIGTAPRRLEAILSEAAAPRAGAVVCHPHPQMGGDMHNSVVLAAARGLGDAGVTTLRFNFGGVGASEGAYGGGDAEVGDVDVAVDALRELVPAGTPLLVVGYSFGAWVGARAAVRRSDVARLVLIAPPTDMIDFAFLRPPLPPCTVIVGDDDAYCHHPERLASVATVRILEDADHFFWGYDDEIAAAVAEAVSA